MNYKSVPVNGAMQKTEKIGGLSANFQVHCFPNFHGARRADVAARDDTGSSFQPLYRDSADPSGRSVSPGIKAAKMPADKEAHHSILQQYYQQGLEVGKKDACSMVQESLAPHVRVFGDSLKTLSRDLQKHVSAAGPGITALALAIAEKILGITVQGDPSRLQIIQDRLQTALDGVYRIKLMMNPKDFETLTDLTGCAELTGADQQAVPVSANPAVERGAIQEKKHRLPMTNKQIDDIIAKSGSPST